ncbi:AraC family transcriptional regulator [Poriferisphaera sp. WC338]|uniref:helix-turn-helix transcriptional regulator n=1 Tax=Poriferisphaera sp. WC338 TaxID=3425129 RepID=UPI003D81BAAB
MAAQEPRSIHTQDYPEVFWIERGCGLHHINGEAKKLQRGDLIWIRPTDSHGFSAINTDGFVLTNLALSTETAETLHSRYFEHDDCFFWQTEKLPKRHHLDASYLQTLMHKADELDRSPRTQLEVDRFLLDLMHHLKSDHDAANTHDLPDWLARALDQYSEPEHFQGGAQALAELAGRTPEHVNATLKQCVGQTATYVINQARMVYAAGQLRISTKEIIEICYECGFDSLGHFYKIFGEYMGTSPRKYRMSHLATLGR